VSITYRGVTLTYAWHTRGITQRAKKEIVFPGVNGITVQEMGERGRNFQIKGRITDISEVTFNPEIIEGWQDGSTGTLVIHGTSFTNCQGRKTDLVVEISIKQQMEILDANII